MNTMDTGRPATTPQGARRLATQSLAALGLAMVLAAPAWAQVNSTFKPWARTLAQPVSPPNGTPGKALLPATYFSQGQASDRKVWATQMRAVIDYLAQIPVLAQPSGFYPEYQSFGALHELPPFVGKKEKAPFVGGVAPYMWPPQTITVQADGTPKLKGGNETYGLRIEFNYQYLPSPWLVDDDEEIGLLAYQGDYMGFPILNEDLLITKDGRLPYRPVSQERLIKAWLKRHSGEVERTRKEVAEALAKGKPSPDLEHGGGYTTYRTVLFLQKQLETMSAEERKLPAWVDANASLNTDVRLLPQGQGTAVVEVDPEFFDPKKPRTQLRFAWVRQLRRFQEQARSSNDNVATHAVMTAFQQVNWREFADKFLVTR